LAKYISCAEPYIDIQFLDERKGSIGELVDAMKQLQVIADKEVKLNRIVYFLR
jgi:hypothetical protein